jgi:hypothetical protein
MKTKTETRVEKHVTSNELIMQGLKDFTDLLEVAIEEKRFTNDTVVGFLAGYRSGLSALGLPNEESTHIGLTMSKIIKELMEDGCGECDNCKANAKQKTKKTAKKK